MRPPYRDDYNAYIVFPSAPGAVTNLTVEDVNSTSLMVSFSTPLSPNGQITRYDILYVQVSSDLQPLMGEEEQTITIQPDEMEMFSEIISRLTPFTNYRIRVVAFTSIGQGELTIRFGVTDPDASSPPTNFRSVTVTSDSVMLEWAYPETPRGIIQGYIIQYHRTDMNTNNPQLENITLTTDDDDSSQNFTISGLIPFTSYNFIVRAYSFGSDPFIVHLGAESVELVIVTGEAGMYVCTVLVSIGCRMALFQG